MRTLGLAISAAIAAALISLGGVAHAETAHHKRHGPEIIATQGIVRGSFKAVPHDMALDHLGGTNAGDMCTNDAVC